MTRSKETSAARRLRRERTTLRRSSGAVEHIVGPECEEDGEENDVASKVASDLLAQRRILPSQLRMKAAEIRAVLNASR